MTTSDDSLEATDGDASPTIVAGGALVRFPLVPRTDHVVHLTGARGARLDRRAMLVLVLTVVVALGLAAATVVVAVATVLTPSCGEDLAWVGLVVAAGIASVTAAVGSYGLVQGWRRPRPPRYHLLLTRGMLLALALSGALAVVAAFWLPDGGCDGGRGGLT